MSAEFGRMLPPKGLDALSISRHTSKIPALSGSSASADSRVKPMESPFVERLSPVGQERGDPRTRLARWHGTELSVTSYDVKEAETCLIESNDHVVATCLSGRIRRLETEVDGRGAMVPSGGPGEVLVVPAGYRYSCHARNCVVSYAKLQLSRTVLREALGNAAERTELQLSVYRCDAFVSEALKRLARLIDQTDDVSQMIGRHLIHALCGHLLQTYPAGVDGAGGDEQLIALTPQAIGRLQQYVQDHIADRINVDALASVAGLEVRGIFRAFRRHFRSTPAQYIIGQRIRRAMWLLANTRHDITSVAMLTGFASHSHLTTTFKKHTGLTPHAYRLQAH